MKVAASPQSINRAMPESGIQVTSHQSLVTPNPQSLIPSYSSLLSNLSHGACRPIDCKRKGSMGSMGPTGAVPESLRLTRFPFEVSTHRPPNRK